MFSRLLKPRQPLKSDAAMLYEKLVWVARQQWFYLKTGVPDTLDGRFEMIALHVALCIRWLQKTGEADRAQALFDQLFQDMEANLREIGVGDLSVGKKVRAMADAFHGRAQVYNLALDQPTDQELDEALSRNVFGTCPVSPPANQMRNLAAYVRSLDETLARTAPNRLWAGDVDLPKNEFD